MHAADEFLVIKSENLLELTLSQDKGTRHIFFAQLVLQQKNLNDQINIAMKKVTGQLTAGMFANYDESVNSFMTEAVII